MNDHTNVKFAIKRKPFEFLVLNFGQVFDSNPNNFFFTFRFKTSAILRRHTRIHQSFKAYCCDICGHRTLDKCALKLHIVRYHTEDSPFPCHICGRKFYSARTMKVKSDGKH